MKILTAKTAYIWEPSDFSFQFSQYPVQSKTGECHRIERMDDGRIEIVHYDGSERRIISSHPDDGITLSYFLNFNGYQPVLGIPEDAISVEVSLSDMFMSGNISA